MTHDPKKCMECGGCFTVCKTNAIQHHREGIILHKDRCNDCGKCEKDCPGRAFSREIE